MRRAVVIAVLCLLPLWLSVPAPAATSGQVSAGLDNVLYIDSAGDLYGWGFNVFGQLGTGSTVDVAVPTKVGVGPWDNISSATSNSAGVRRDGSLWAWGANDSGQLGDGTTTPSLVPKRVGALNDWKQVSVGNLHMVALKKDGTIWAWGDNAGGQLGVDPAALTSSPTPLQVGADNRWVAVAAGSAHCLALRDDGSLWAWGDNHFSQCGLVDPLIVTSPTLLIAADIVDMDAGDFHGLAVDNVGQLYAWGLNNTGQAGTPGQNTVPTPTPVFTTAQMAAVQAGRDYSLAIAANGGLWAWGDNTNGQLGNGDPLHLQVDFPAAIGAALDWESVSAGAGATAAVGYDGLLRLWGDLTGTGFASDEPIPQAVFISRLSYPLEHHRASTYFQSLVLRRDGSLWGWGRNDFGQAGNGTAGVDVLVPTRIGTDTDWISVGAGEFFSAALKRDGTVYAWGSNANGQLGADPLLVTASITPLQLQTALRFKALAVGRHHCLAIATDGTLWGWGSGLSGELGNDLELDQFVPVQVAFGSNWVVVDAGSFYSTAIRSDGSLWAWGDNQFGQLGSVTLFNSLHPVRLSPLRAARVDIGVQHTLFQTLDGAVYGLGRNDADQLSDAAGGGLLNPALAVPVRLALPTGSLPLAGELHSLALTPSGTMQGWGSNNGGQLGDSTTTSSAQPVPAAVGVAGIRAAAAGVAHSMAVTGNDAVWTWGSNFNGQLGDGTIAPSPLPVQVMPGQPSLGALPLLLFQP